MSETRARFDAAPWLLRAGLLAGLGAIAALGQAPLDWWPATIIALAVFLAVTSGTDGPGRAFWQNWWLGLGYFAVSLRWIVAPFLVDPARDGWMAPFAMVLMAAGAALFWGLAGWLTARLGGGALLRAMLLAGAEVTRSLILTGFPWALFGHVWVETPLAQLAAFGGPHLLTLLTIALAWSLTLRRWSGGIIPVALAGAWAVFQMNMPPPDALPDAPVVRLVQPNAPQNEKWDPARRAIFFDRMIAFTAEAPRPDLTVWPETALPQFLDYSQPLLDRMTTAARGALIIAGANRSSGSLYHNALFLIDRDGFVAAVYDKVHLVPFGEYIPFAAWLGATGMVPMNAMAGFTPGTGTGLIDLPGIGLARTLICYEGIFAEEIATDVRPRLLVLITNDAWFGPAAGPRQHLAQARLRAIEQGLPMVRVANTGISAMIDAQGRVRAQIGMNEAGYLDATLPPAAPPTLYARFGDGPVIILLVLGIGCIAAFGRKS